MIKRLVDPTAVVAKADDQIILDAILAELARANPSFRATLGKDAKDALMRRDARRPAR